MSVLYIGYSVVIGWPGFWNSATWAWFSYCRSCFIVITIIKSWFYITPFSCVLNFVPIWGITEIISSETIWKVNTAQRTLFLELVLPWWSTFPFLVEWTILRHWQILLIIVANNFFINSVQLITKWWKHFESIIRIIQSV